MRNLIAAILVFLSLISFGQWQTNGNFGVAPADFLGPINNMSLKLRSDNLERLRINHRGPGLVLPGYAPFSMINPYPGNRLTRIGISIDGNSPITLPMAALHIGYDWLPGAGVQGGFRDWMNIGTMYMEGTDQMYVGLREKSQFDITGRTSALSVTQQDGQDAVINWGDNFSFENTAPNNLTFIFTSVRNNANNFANTAYGREVARMTPEGNMGIGPVFFDNAQPQSLLHINNNAFNNAFLQISNTGASNQTATDGIKLGIEGATANAFLYNQENRPLMFSTNALPTTYNVGHRVMITNLGSATQPVGGIGNTTPELWLIT